MNKQAAPTIKRVAYTSAEVAAMTGRNRTTVWRWMNSGVLQRVKVPHGRDMVSAASLEKLLRVDPAGGPR